MQGIVAHIHQNVKFTNPVSGKDAVEIDAVVLHVGGENVAGSSAYLLECALSPQAKDVQIIQKKLEVFNAYAKTSRHFSTVNNVVPVLAGRNWSAEIVDACEASKTTLWRVSPSGKSLKVHNNLFSK
jgi:hypothetical protein